jgi:S-adenosylmethionine-diacylgycerolhomoserine-N-methlytransferase
MSHPVQDTGHAALMDATYRHQRLIYDATRAWFLLGRDTLIDRLDPPPGARVLEIACGTGRNLDRIGRRHPGCQLFGLDISAEMLRTARAKLGTRARLAEADACRFDPQALFGEAAFDRIVLSYCLSMIPDWTAALREATRHLAPGGAVHIVDFGLQDGLPGAFRRGLAGWLGRFHVTPRPGLRAAVEALAAERGLDATWTPLHRSYAQHASLSRPAQA